MLFLRGEPVLLDTDLAELYDVSVKQRNQAVKRNRQRFPPDFVFQLTEAEWNASRSQVVTSNRARGGRRGALMLPRPAGRAHPSNSRRSANDVAEADR